MKEKKKKLRKTNSHNKNSEQDISHETEPTNTSNSQENTENNDTEREENDILQNQELYPEKNTTHSYTGKHTSQETANKSKRLRYTKFVIILGGNIAKPLDGWEMAENTI